MAPVIPADGFDGLVSALYATVVDGDAWPAALAVLRARFDCAIADLNTKSAGGRRSLSTEPSVSAVYAGHWAAVNPINSMGLTAGTVALVHDFVDRDMLIRSAYYNDFLLPADIPQVMVIRGPTWATGGAIINIMRGRRQPAFDAAELALANRLSGHVVNALRMAAVLGWKSWTELTASFEAAQEGMVLVDAAGAVLHMNRVARALTGARDGIVVDGRGLDATFDRDGRRLREAIWRATGGPTPRTGGMLAIERPSGARALIASITPLAEHLVDIGAPIARALIAVLDPECATASPAADLQRLFGLTRREADITRALGEGLSIAEVAARCGVTLATARNYLARVLRKTQLTRQGDLVMLLNGLSRLAEASRRG